MTQPKNQNPLVRHAKAGLLILCGLFLLYFLSAGPAIRLAQSRAISTDAMLAAYSPLFFSMEIIPGGDWVMKKYVSLWELPVPP